MQSVRTKAVESLKAAVHAARQATAAFHRFSPDGNAALNLEGKNEADLAAIRQDIEAWEDWRRQSQTHYKTFDSMYSELVKAVECEKEDEHDTSWPKDIGDLLCELMHAQPEFAQKAVDTAVVDLFRDTSKDN